MILIWLIGILLVAGILAATGGTLELAASAMDLAHRDRASTLS